MSLLSADIKKRVAARVAECCAIASKHYGMHIDMPQITYTTRGTTAGKAYYHAHRVDFNARLLIENVEDFMIDTIPHEVAHLVDILVHGFTYRGAKVSQHGPTWKSVMRVLGADPQRCHNYDVSNVKVKRKSYKYQCTKCGATVELGPKRHANVKRKMLMYRHAKCGGTLDFLHVVHPKRPHNTLAAASTKGSPPKSKKTKKERAIEIYRTNTEKSRNEIIALLISELDMGKGGATTYYYQAKKVVEGN